MPKFGGYRRLPVKGGGLSRSNTIMSIKSTCSSIRSNLSTSTDDQGESGGGGREYLIVGTYCQSSVYEEQPNGKPPLIPADLPVEDFTHLIYSSGKISADGKLVPLDKLVDTVMEFDQGADADAEFSGVYYELNCKLKRRNPSLKTLISIGGWDDSFRISDICASLESRQVFVDSIVEFLQKFKFDGVNIDWEFPVEGGSGLSENFDGAAPKMLCRPVDGDNFVLLLSALKNAFQDFGFLISVDLPANYEYLRHFNLEQMVQHVDFFNVLCFDLRGAWSSHTGHVSALYRSNKDPVKDSKSSNVASIIKYLISNNVPSYKLVLGVSLKGRAFGNVHVNETIPERPGLRDLGASYGTGGLFRPFDMHRTPRGTFAGDDGGFEFWHLKRDLLSQKPHVQEFWDAQCRASYLYDSSKKVMVSFESERSLVEKAKFVMKIKLAGIMIADISADCYTTESGSWELLEVMVKYLWRKSRIVAVLNGRNLQSGSNTGVSKPVVLLDRSSNSKLDHVDDVSPNLVDFSSLSKKVLGFFTNTSIYEKGFEPSKIPFHRLSHLHYAFAKVGEDGAVSLSDQWADIDKPFAGESCVHSPWTDFPQSKESARGCIHQINYVFKPKFGQLKTLLSVGGWNYSEYFSSIAFDDIKRSNFAKSAVDLAVKLGFDGIDIVWEYPVEGGKLQNQRSKYDGWGLMYLCRELRKEFAMRNSNSSWLISVGLPSHLRLIEHIPVSQLSGFIDYCHLLSFDNVGAQWSKKTGHHAPLYPEYRDDHNSASLYDAVAAYCSNGMAGEKILIGIPTYGRGFANVSPGDDKTKLAGLGQDFAAIPSSGRESDSAGVFDFSYLHAKFMAKSGGLQYIWDDNAKAAYLFGPVKCIDNSFTNVFISFEDSKSAAAKTSLVNAWNLGGVALWDLSGDVYSKDAGLLDTCINTIQSNEKNIPSWVSNNPPNLKPFALPEIPLSGNISAELSGSMVSRSRELVPLVRDMPTSPTFPKKIVGYFISWGIYARGYKATDIPVEKLTHLNYAFARIQDGSWTVQIGDSYADTEYLYPGQTWDPNSKRGNFAYINNDLRKRNPQLKTLISIGGWTWSSNFSTMAASAANRNIFAKSCVDFITKWGFDGVDLDWEYPVEGGLDSNVRNPSDGVNYTLTLQAIRDQFNILTQQTGKKYLITIAAPAGPSLVRHLEIAKMGQVLDFINVMSYDYRGGWSPYTGHQTPLYPSSKDPYTELGCTQQIVDTFLAGGCPPDKLVIGAAMYGRGFQSVPTTANGLFQKYGSIPMGTWDALGSEGATGVYDYKDVVRRALPRFWDDEVKAAWGFQGGLMISYDDPQSMKEKCWFVNAKKLGGVMFWELSGDVAGGSPGCLLDVIVSTLGSGAVPDGPRPGISGSGGGTVTPPPIVPPPIVTPPVVIPPVVTPPVVIPVDPPVIVTPPVVIPPSTGTGGNTDQVPIGGQPSDPGNSGPYLVIGRYTYWSALNGFTLDSIPLDQLTHLVYAYAKVDADGTVSPGDNYADLNFPYGPVKGGYAFLNSILKPLYPGLKTLLSFGGYSGSDNFASALAASNLQKFVTNAVTMMNTQGFDGIEIAWEWPGLTGSTSGSIGQDLTLLSNALSLIRKSLSQGQLLTINIPGQESLIPASDYSSMATNVDWCNVYTFDYVNSSSTTTNHFAPLMKPNSSWNFGTVSGSIDKWNQIAKVPLSKLVAGVPFYGRAWMNIADNGNKGLGVSVTEANLVDPPAENDLTTGSSPEPGLYQVSFCTLDVFFVDILLCLLYFLLCM